MKLHWSKFYWSDWRGDPKLRICSIGARGLWIEMLCIMNEATPIGHLLVNGIYPTDKQLSVLVGVPVDELPGLLSELDNAGVFSRNGKGVIYSRRVVRDEKKSIHARKVGKTGGNPSLSNQTGISTQDNPPVNQKDKGGDNTQKLEARSYKLESKRVRQISDLKLDDEFRALASPLSAETEIDKFRDWCAANARTYRDYRAAFRNWLRKAHEYAGTNKGNGTDKLPGAYKDANGTWRDLAGGAMSEAEVNRARELAAQAPP